MLIPDTSFRGLIIQELEGGDKSISHLHRCLAERGHKVHRLVLTGYLKAMEDMGILSSREIPPSIVYFVSPSADIGLHGMVGMVCRDMLDISPEEQPAVTMYFFQKLFRRPVFLEEMRRAGFESEPGTYATQVSNEERTETRKMLGRSGIKLPARDPAYMIVDRKYDAEYEEILQALVLRKFKVSSLAMTGKQTKLV